MLKTPGISLHRLFALSLDQIMGRFFPEYLVLDTMALRTIRGIWTAAMTKLLILGASASRDSGAPKHFVPTGSGG